MADGEHSGEAKAKFHSFAESTQEDWMIIGAASTAFSQELPTRVLAHLKMLEGDCGGFPVDRLEHSLQTATRAFRANKDEEYVVCALLHDMGDILATRNHADIGAAVLKPYVSEQNHWMVENHAIFQGYYFFHHFGLDRNLRDQFKGHPWYEYTAQFCHLYDQPAFDPAYESMPLEAFEPMVGRVFSQVKRSIYMKEDGASAI